MAGGRGCGVLTGAQLWQNWERNPRRREDAQRKEAVTGSLRALEQNEETFHQEDSHESRTMAASCTASTVVHVWDTSSKLRTSWQAAC
jgi:hypothetical protein